MTRFVDGLKEEIRSVIALHRPPDVDMASALALLQEEEITRGKSKFGGYPCGHVKMGYEKTKTSKVEKGKGEGHSKESEDKLAALKESRRRNGLCFKCGAKWGHNHKCAAQVPLHVLEKILDALEPTEDSDSDGPQQMEDEVIATVSQSNSLDSIRRRTMRICGHIGKVNVLILVDSGSVGSFISDKLAAQLQVKTVPCPPIQLMTTDGSPMVCVIRGYQIYSGLHRTIHLPLLWVSFHLGVLI